MIYAELMRAGEMALAYYKAQQSVKSAKHEYHMAWRRFELDAEADEDVENLFVDAEDWICKGHIMFFEACDATKKEYQAYQDAKLAARKAKRKLDTACKAAL